MHVLIVYRSLTSFRKASFGWKQRVVLFHIDIKFPCLSCLERREITNRLMPLLTYCVHVAVQLFENFSSWEMIKPGKLNGNNIRYWRFYVKSKAAINVEVTEDQQQVLQFRALSSLLTMLTLNLERAFFFFWRVFLGGKIAFSYKTETMCPVPQFSVSSYSIYTVISCVLPV